MIRASRTSVLGVVVATVLVGLVPGARATPIVDQSFTSPSDLSAQINECCRYVAQTFTAGRTGVLEGINISVEGFRSSGLHVAIRAVEAGRPTGTVLAGTTLDSNSARLSRLITFPTEVIVTAGVQYAIVVNYDGAPSPGPGQARGGWSGATGDMYTRGALLFSELDGLSWFSSSTGHDVHFRTHVSGAEIRLTGGTRLLPDGDVIVLDEQGRGHRLRAHPEITAQLAALAGRTMTVVGTAVEDPAEVPNFPITVFDFRIEPGGAFDGQDVSVTGRTRRLPDGDVIVSDDFGHGHRLRATGALRNQIDEIAGIRVTVVGRADVTNTASRLNWPIDVTSIADITPDYEIVDLGAGNLGQAINERGLVAGSSSGSTGFVYSGGALTPIAMAGFGINDHGAIAGVRFDQFERATLLSHGSFEDLAPLPGSVVGSGVANDVNELGQAVGQTPADAASGFAVLWDHGTVRDLGALGAPSSAVAINDKGQIVGSSARPGFTHTRAFLWENGATHDLGTLGGAGAQALDINDHGEIVGLAQTAAGIAHPFVYRNGEMVDLGVPPGSSQGVAWAVNDEGDVVGQSTLPSDGRAFVYRDGEMADLNDLIPQRLGWLLAQATDINDKGEIVGWGWRDDAQHGFLARPVG